MTSKYFSCGLQAVFFLALPLVGACSFAGQIAKDSVEGATSYYSREHFTLVATFPAKFGFTSKAQYSPKAGESCQTYSPGLGGSVTRQQQKSNTTEAKDVEQTASTYIPLEFHIADCSMELTRVDYEISGTYGTDAWDHGMDRAGGLLVREKPLQAAKDPSPNVIDQRGLCTWLFQISTAKARKDGIEKILSCNAADNQWSVPEDYFERKKPGGVVYRNNLNQKTVKIRFQLSEIEEPSKDNRWIKTASGWRPCQKTEKSERCATPPVFRTFKMNGRDCSIYPACSE